MSEVSDGIHTSHCCHKHGCKYAFHAGDEASCPVMTGALRQEFPCEFCELSHPEQDKAVDEIVSWLEGRVKELREMDTRVAGYIRQSAYDRADHYDDVIRGIKERAWKK